MARKAVREYSDDFGFGCLLLGIAMGVGVGFVTSGLTHNDPLSIGAGLIAGSGMIFLSLLLLY